MTRAGGSTRRARAMARVGPGRWGEGGGSGGGGADAAGEPVLLLAGGSNLVIADAGFPGLVVGVATRGVDQAPAEDGGARVTVQAGEEWDAGVAAAVADGLAGIECLSGIPGSTGA